MTKEEKIICKAYLNDLDRTHDCNEYKLLMELLDREPCEDAVSRQVVLDTMQMKMGGKELYKAVYEMPPVTPTQKWIPMVRREPTEEEKAEYLAQNGEELCFMLENEMPLNGQEVLVSIGEFVAEDVFDEDFFNFESNDIENVDAWMPKPKAYKAETESENGNN